LCRSGGIGWPGICSVATACPIERAAKRSCADCCASISVSSSHTAKWPLCKYLLDVQKSALLDFYVVDHAVVISLRKLPAKAFKPGMMFIASRPIRKATPYRVSLSDAIWKKLTASGVVKMADAKPVKKADAACPRVSPRRKVSDRTAPCKATSGNAVFRK